MTYIDFPGLTHKPHSWARRKYGCDCSKCLPSGRAGSRQQQWSLDRLSHYPSSIARQRHGCDCRKCLPSGVEGPGGRPSILGDRPLTSRERQLRLRQAKRGTPVPEGVKHGGYCRRVYRCHCEASREYIRERNRKDRDKARGRTSNAPLRGRWSRTIRNGEELDVICWPPKDAGPDWKCRCEERAA